MDKIKDIFKEIVSFDNLYYAAMNAQRDKRYRKEVLDFNARLEFNLIELQNELIWHEYEIGNYRERFIYEPKKRLIMALPYRDRVVQWALYRQVEPIVDATFYKHSYACRPGKGSYACIDKMQEWLTAVEGKGWHYGIFDISKFFYRISHDVIMWDNRNRIDDEETLWLYDVIINSDKKAFGLPEGMDADKVAIEDRLFNVGMPIGNLTSQSSGNKNLDNLDWCIVNELGFGDADFLDEAYRMRAGSYQYPYDEEDVDIMLNLCDGATMRYLDDGIIFAKDKEKIWEAIEKIRNYAKGTLRLELNHKTRVGRCDDGVSWLGCNVWADKVRLKRNNRNRMIRKLNMRRNLHEKGRISDEKLEATENSYRARLEYLGCDGLKRYLGL